MPAWSRSIEGRSSSFGPDMQDLGHVTFLEPLGTNGGGDIIRELPSRDRELLIDLVVRGIVGEHEHKGPTPP